MLGQTMRARGAFPVTESLPFLPPPVTFVTAPVTYLWYSSNCLLGTLPPDECVKSLSLYHTLGG